MSKDPLGRETLCAQEDSARANHQDGLFPPLRGAGPVVPPGPTLDFEDYDNYDRACIEEIYLAMVEEETDISCQTLIRRVGTSAARSWRTFARSLKVMQEELNEEDMQILGDRGPKLILSIPGPFPIHLVANPNYLIVILPSMRTRLMMLSLILHRTIFGLYQDL